MRCRKVTLMIPMINSIPFLPLVVSVMSLLPIAPTFAQSIDETDTSFSYTCRQEDNQILVEIKNVKNWKQIIEQDDWTCTENTATKPIGQLTFSCEPQSDDILGIITVTWLNGQDQKRQMGQWMHQFVTDNKMSCSLSTTEIL